METNNNDLLISQSELMNILRIKSKRTLGYKKKFKITLIDDSVYFSKKEIEDFLLTKIDEPFIISEEAAKILNIPISHFNLLVKKGEIPYYTFSFSKSEKIKRGCRMLFKESEIKKFQELYPNIFIKHFFSSNKTYYLNLLFNKYIEVSEKFYNTREYQILRSFFIENESIDVIGEKWDITPSRIRSLIQRAIRRTNAHIEYVVNAIRLYEEYGIKNFELTKRISYLENIIESEFNKEVKSKPTEQLENLLRTSIVDLDISTRGLNALKAANMKTLADLVSLDRNDLLKFRNCGKKSLAEIEDIVESKGLHFGMDLSKYGLTL